MESNDLKLLTTVEDRLLAQDIQSLLEEQGIHTLLESDNPAFSVVGTYGFNPIESIEIKINGLDYKRAIEILVETPYKEFIE